MFKLLFLFLLLHFAVTLSSPDASLTARNLLFEWGEAEDDVVSSPEVHVEKLPVSLTRLVDIYNPAILTSYIYFSWFCHLLPPLPVLLPVKHSYHGIFRYRVVK